MTAETLPGRHQEHAMDPTSTVWLELLGQPFQQRFYDAGGIRTRVVEAGTGEPLLLLHGTGGHAETYQRNLAPLAGQFRVAAVDMLGHGFSDRPEVDYNLDDYADHLVALLDAMGIERANVSGESLGAMVAAWVAIKHPGRVRRIVMNTGTLARPDEQGMAQLADLEQRTMALAEDLTIEKVRRRMEWLVRDPTSMTDETVAARFRIYSQPGMLATVVQIMGTVLGMIRGTYPRDYFTDGILGRIQCPVMVLWTEHNPGQSAELAKSTLGQFREVEFHVLSNAAHWPQFEDPDEFNRLHRSFLTA